VSAFLFEIAYFFILFCASFLGYDHQITYNRIQKSNKRYPQQNTAVNVFHLNRQWCQRFMSKVSFSPIHTKINAFLLLKAFFKVTVLQHQGVCFLAVLAMPEKGIDFDHFRLKLRIICPRD